MNDFDRELELAAELAAANPYDESFVESQIPVAAGDAMLREITSGDKVSLKQRLSNVIDDALKTPAWSRAGFVGVLALVALAFVAIRPGSPGQEAATDVAVPVGTIEVPASECQASGPTLSDARQAYEQECGQLRLDCDPIGGRWLCSSEQIDDGQPRTTTTTPTTALAPSSSESLEVAAGIDDTTPRSTGGQATGGAADSESSRAGAQSSSPASTQPQQTPAQVPVGGRDCISIEAEQLPLSGAWSQQGDPVASGGAFIVWKGLAYQQNNDLPADVISIDIAITAPGSYRFIWAMRQPEAVADDRANDSWVNFPNAARFGPVGGGSYSGFVKVFGNAKGNFGWTATADQFQSKSQVAIDFPETGTYTIQLAGRSHGHEIDRIIIHQDSVSRTDAIAGNCDAGSTSAPEAEPVVASGPFNPSRDLVSLHYDHASDRDDAHSAVAGRVLTDTYGLTPWVVGGAYGTNGAGYQQSSEAVMDATWGSEWVNADRDWNGAVLATADRWQQALNNGGRVWIAEGGQSDLSADVVRELKRRMPDLDTDVRINLVQHSNWNVAKTTPSDLSYVMTNVNYIQIDDGNSSNGTADLNTVTSGWEQRARDSHWGSAWSTAFHYLDPETRLDFSDAVALFHILGIPKSEIGTTSDFADRYFG